MARTDSPDEVFSPGDKLLRHEQAAEFLGIRPNTLAAYRQKGTPAIPYVQYGGSRSPVFYRLSDLRAFVENSIRHNTSEAKAKR